MNGAEYEAAEEGAVLGVRSGKKRVTLNSDDEIIEDEPEVEDEGAEALADQSDGSEQDYPHEDGGRSFMRPRTGLKFSEKLVEKYQSPWQPSATPSHLQHRFMVSERKMATFNEVTFTL